MRWFVLMCVPLMFACPKDSDVKNGGEQKIPFMAFEGADLEKGKATYNEACASCHGAEGKGDGAMGANFDVKPTDFVTWPTMPSDERIFGWVRDGGASNGGSALMPSYNRSMNAEQLRDVSAYIKTFVKK